MIETNFYLKLTYFVFYKIIHKKLKTIKKSVNYDNRRNCTKGNRLLDEENRGHPSFRNGSHHPEPENDWGIQRRPPHDVAQQATPQPLLVLLRRSQRIRRTL